MAKSQFFRVAVEGATTDGRAIDAQWIRDIVETYNPETYTALVNCEHVTGVSPDGPFGSYGRVTAVKSETVQLSIGGKLVNKLALYAQIEANDNLLALNRAKQKMFGSIEVNPKFSTSGKAYLMGIAVTNTPASLGTEMMKFCASQGEANPLAHRKQSPDNLFTASEEITLDFATGAAAAVIGAAEGNTGGFLDIIKTLLPFATQKAAVVPAAPVVETPPAKTPPASEFAALGAAMIAMAENHKQQSDAFAQQIATGAQNFADLKKLLETSSSNNFRQRPIATGADEGERADC